MFTCFYTSNFVKELIDDNDAEGSFFAGVKSMVPNQFLPN